MSRFRPSLLSLSVLLPVLGLGLGHAPAVYAQAEPPVPVAGAAERAYPGTIDLHVDATDLARRVFHVRQRIPAQPGEMTLLFPKWIPGKHRADGPIHKLAGLKASAGGQRVEWRRDPYDVYAFRLEVPAGADAVEVEFDMVTSTSSDQGRIVMTADMLNLEWGTVALYPAGYPVAGIRMAPSVTYPAGWQAGTALEPQRRAGDTVHYAAVDFETLQDSPVYAGRHFRQFDLAPGAERPVRLDVVADAPRYLEATDEQIEAHRELVRQSLKLFDSEHYDHYDFLFSLSDRMSGNGLEHHRSSENGRPPGYFTEWDKNVAGRDLLPHEFVHSWNGKFRRPAGLATPDFHQPMDGSLLWVYEGQTQYWGIVLAARAGLWTREEALAEIALIAATYADDRPGFDWRTLQDTTYDPVIAMRRPKPYRAHQLSEDYYNGGALVWLAVDAKLRELSGERRSLDDFASAFFGIGDGSWEVVPYEFEDVVATLEEIAPHDWAGFLRERLDANAPPLDGLTAAGWKLVYTDTPTSFHKRALAARGLADHTASLGLVVGKGGGVGAVRWDGPAFNAGIATGATVLAVNGYRYDAAQLEDAIRTAQADGTPVELVVRHGDVVRTVDIDYRGGLKYPRLERIDGSRDRLGKILKPR